jgi:hypothetical protein
MKGIELRGKEKKMVEMVDHQTGNQAANPLKMGKKRKKITSSGTVEFQS